MELINKSSKYVQGEQGGSNEYTLIVKTLHMDGGWNVGIMRWPAYVDFRLTLQNAAGENVAVLRAENAKGADAMGFDFNMWDRLRESYAKCGKTMGKYLSKKLK